MALKQFASISYLLTGPTVHPDTQGMKEEVILDDLLSLTSVTPSLHIPSLYIQYVASTISLPSVP